MTGHQLGAAGAFEAWVCIQALRSKMAPQSVNLEDPDPECALCHIRREPKALMRGHTFALSNSFAFGGTNAALVFETIR